MTMELWTPRGSVAVNQETDRNSTFGEFGVVGLNEQGGYVYEEFLRELRGPNGLRVYDEMRRNDPIIKSMINAICLPIRQIEWKFDPDTEDAGQVETAEFLEQAMSDMSYTWESFIAHVLTSLPFGWSYFEIVYKRRQGRMGDPRSKYKDGKIGWRKFGFRAQSTLLRWQFDESGGLP